MEQKLLLRSFIKNQKNQGETVPIAIGSAGPRANGQSFQYMM